MAETAVCRVQSSVKCHHAVNQEFIPVSDGHG
jgi:hypothetical protein